MNEELHNRQVPPFKKGVRGILKNIKIPPNLPFLRRRTDPPLAEKGGVRFVILHNIRSLHNVGSMFRTADAIGVSKIYLTGYTPVPMDAFGKMRPEITKTALGAERTVLWEQKKNIGSLLSSLHQEGIYVIGLEQHSRAVDYRRVKPKKSWVLVVGNEVRGLSDAVLEKCDVVAEIPLHGTKESLNVSVAFGIALFSIYKD